MGSTQYKSESCLIQCNAKVHLRVMQVMQCCSLIMTDSTFSPGLCAGSLSRRASGCQCMGRREAEVWQCRSKLARGLIVRRCLTHFAGGFKAWAYVLMISLACMLGLWSSVSIMHRYYPCTTSDSALSNCACKTPGLDEQKRKDNMCVSMR